MHLPVCCRANLPVLTFSRAAKGGGDMEENKPRNFSSSLVTIPTSILLTAFATWLTNDLLERPRPQVEIATIAFEGLGATGSIFRPSAQLEQTYDAITLILKDFSSTKQVTIQDARKWLEEAEYHKARIERSKSTFASMLDALDNSTGVSEDELRKRILRFANEDSETYVKLALSASKPFFSSVFSDAQYQRYQRHPEGWSSGPQTRISLGDYRFYDLSEIREKADNGQEDMDKIRTNIHRRLFIYMVPQHLREVLSAAREAQNDDLAKLDEFLELLRSEIEQVDPTRVRATLIIQNFGKQAAMFRNAAVLEIDVPSSPKVRLAKSSNEGLDPAGAFVVPAGETVSVNYYSAESIEALGDSADGKSSLRLRELVGAKAVRGSVRLAQLTQGQGENRVKSASVILGEDAVRQTWDTLAK